LKIGSYENHSYFTIFNAFIIPRNQKNTIYYRITSVGKGYFESKFLTLQKKEFYDFYLKNEVYSFFEEIFFILFGTLRFSKTKNLESECFSL
jgi:hypothetical protein